MDFAAHTTALLIAFALAVAAFTFLIKRISGALEAVNVLITDPCLLKKTVYG
jgi:hypothetical protein